MNDERRRWYHDLWILLGIVVAVPGLLIIGFTLPRLGIAIIPLLLGLSTWRMLRWRGSASPGVTERVIEVMTGLIVASFFGFFGERIVFLLLILIFGAS